MTSDGIVMIHDRNWLSQIAKLSVRRLLAGLTYPYAGIRDMFDEMKNQPGFNAFATLLGIRLTEVNAEFAECELDVSADHFHPGGVVHGGVAYSMADTAMALCLLKGLGDHQNCATIEAKISYLAPVRAGTLRCRSRVVKRGSRIAFLAADVFANDLHVATATGTFALQSSQR